MLLGALVGAGAELAELQRLVDLVLPGAVRLDRRPVARAGMSATKVDVTSLVADHHHRPWAAVRELLEAAPDDLPEPVRRDALRVFERLATVEGEVHGVPTDDVELHEVGSWDSIADVVGVCAGLHLLGVTDLVAGPLALGSGSVRTAHGTLPVPVPAVLGLLEGWSASAAGHGELATPTGVALVTTLAREEPGMPPMRVVRSAAGAGTRDTPDRPNVVRLVLGPAAPAPAPDGTAAATGPAGPEALVVLEANVDDLDPRVWPSVLTALLDAGAADVWLVPIVMKKGRPAHTLTVLADPALAPLLRDRVLDLTSTLGVRQTAVRRWALARGWADVDVDGVPVAVKVAHQDGAVVHATPEFEQVQAAATRLGRPVRDVLAAAGAAAAAAGLARGRGIPAGLREQQER
jgi:pyridinium-3,5-bisthiocarboxylic acid mononucleotide nickel chelatase